MRFHHAIQALTLSLIGMLSIAWADEKPNIVIILTDDQGYADVSYNPHSPPEVSTPNIDALAHSSIICTQGYTSGHVCSPTRAGLMTGRYQQRFGIYTAGEGGSGVPLDEVFIPQRLKPAGYVSGALGKWHLGLTEESHAMKRGFDEFYGFMGRGAHPYFDHSDMEHPIYRGLKPIKDEGYLTTRITEEAVDFINRHSRAERDSLPEAARRADAGASGNDQPFFLYVAYNAVHAPAEAPEEDIKNVTGDKKRDTLMAMIKHLDMGVGEIVKSLKQHDLFDNTLLVFLTDNGGAGAMNANNAPLRGFKQMDYEGGIHVPFIVSWPAQLEGGKKCNVPMWSIDLFATALDAAGLPMPKDKPLDGKSILPALKGETDKFHDELYWSSGGDKGKWAIRSGNWKLVAEKNRRELFDLEKDLSETTDLAAKHPKVVSKLTDKYNAWLDEMAEPVSKQGKRWNPDAGAPAKRMSKKEKKAARDKKKAKRIKER
ncbi:MAG: sulfatase-like hydrolase/transferase [Verrucomicrobiaceae bacterium]|nr:sulfatase-like hydrolase/transferase [Verrucomicrobiaceae bacterium]